MADKQGTWNTCVCLSMVTLSDSHRQDERFWTEKSQTFPELSAVNYFVVAVLFSTEMKELIFVSSNY